MLGFQEYVHGWMSFAKCFGILAYVPPGTTEALSLM